MARTAGTAVREADHQLPADVISLLPRQGNWTEDAYLWLTDNANRLIEFSDGFLEVLPMPTDRHQTIVAFLYDTLRVFLGPHGKTLFAPLRLRLAGGRIREPDIVVLLAADDPRRSDRYWTGADLVVEVVSPGGEERDLVAKRTEYAEAGIAEYWIVDPVAETLTVLRLEDAAYQEHDVFGRGAMATSPILLGFQLSVDAVFDAV